jgi:hypothetical protein
MALCAEVSLWFVNTSTIEHLVGAVVHKKTIRGKGADKGREQDNQTVFLLQNKNVQKKKGSFVFGNRGRKDCERYRSVSTEAALWFENINKVVFCLQEQF